MRFWSIWIPGVIIFGVASIVSPGGGALGQTVENPGFKALPRPVNYATPLAPAHGAKAVIVFGKNAAWSQKSAEAVKQAIQGWSGAEGCSAPPRHPPRWRGSAATNG